MAELTQERLKELLHYDPETGVFTWRVSRGTRAAGSEAGCVTSNHEQKKHARRPYVRKDIRVERKLYLAHRLAWLYMTGAWPPEQIDHIDGDALNNRFDNLRAVTHAQNHLNRPRNRNNTSGVIGVFFDKNGYCKPWRAQIDHNGKRWNKGFKTKEEAIAWRREAAARLGYHENHGRD